MGARIRLQPFASGGGLLLQRAHKSLTLCFAWLPSARLKTALAVVEGTVRYFGMFVVSEAIIVAVRQAWEGGGEFAAAVELRRHYPGITDIAAAQQCVQAILQWQPLPPLPRKPPRTQATSES